MGVLRTGYSPDRAGWLGNARAKRGDAFAMVAAICLFGCRHEDSSLTNIASRPFAGPLTQSVVNSGQFVWATGPQNVGVPGAINALLPPGPLVTFAAPGSAPPLLCAGATACITSVGYSAFSAPIVLGDAAAVAGVVPGGPILPGVFNTFGVPIPTATLGPLDSFASPLTPPGTSPARTRSTSLSSRWGRTSPTAIASAHARATPSRAST